MYKLKKKPEDFIVKEVSEIKTQKSGRFSICLLKKTNYTTQRAVEHIASKLNKNPNEISFAGTKDKAAITEQHISIKGAGKERIEKLKLKDIEVKFLGYSNEPVSLGMLEGNEFTITIYTKDKPNLADTIMPNFFGEQRFSKNNTEIGRLLVKDRFKEAVELILKTDSDYKKEIKNYYLKNDFISALRCIPKRLLQMYVHSYQSFIWNKTLEEYMQATSENIEIPLIGFGTEINNGILKHIIDEIMEEEKITFRDFIKKQPRDLSLEGDLRKAFVEIKDLKIIEDKKDRVKISFSLPKASYATEAVKFLFKS